MAVQVQLRRGTEGQNNAFTGVVAELTVDTTNNKLRVHDGSTAGGHVIGGGGLTNFTEAESTASPNDTVSVDSLTAAAAATNADVALVAKGTGATLAQVPDGTSAGGNKRGTYATDLQKIRSTAAQVASGNYSTIAGGQRNTASGAYSAIGGGYSNTASGSGATVAGGEVNTASGSVYPTIAGGTGNTASSNYSFVGGGQSNEAKTNTHATCAGGSSNDATGSLSFVGGGISNTASGLRSVVVAGDTNVASGANSCIVGGIDNIANASQSFVAGGRRGTVRSIVGNHIFPACSIPITNAQGATQSALLLLGRQTTDATATVLCSDSSAAGTTNQVILPNNSAYHFKGSVIATVTGGGNTASWEFKGAIKRGVNAASTAIVSTVIKDVVAYDAGASAWDVTFTADTTNGGLKVEVTGAAATTIRWVARLETTEVTY